MSIASQVPPLSRNLRESGQKPLLIMSRADWQTWPKEPDAISAYYKAIRDVLKTCAVGEDCEECDSDASLALIHWCQTTSEAANILYALRED